MENEKGEDDMSLNSDEMEFEKDSFIRLDNLHEYEKTILQEIRSIKKEVDAFKTLIKESSEKTYEDLNNIAENLLQTILKLDNIDSKNSENIKEARKTMVLYAQQVLNEVDQKFNKHSADDSIKLDDDFDDS